MELAEGRTSLWVSAQVLQPAHTSSCLSDSHVWMTGDMILSEPSLRLQRLKLSFFFNQRTMPNAQIVLNLCSAASRIGRLGKELRDNGGVRLLELKEGN